MQKKVIKKTIEEQIQATQERLQKLHKNKQHKINRTLLISFSFLTSESEILNLLNKNSLDKEFQERLKKYLFNFEEFKSISRVAKSEESFKEDLKDSIGEI